MKMKNSLEYLSIALIWYLWILNLQFQKVNLTSNTDSVEKLNI